MFLFSRKGLSSPPPKATTVTDNIDNTRPVECCAESGEMNQNVNSKTTSSLSVRSRSKSPARPKPRTRSPRTTPSPPSSSDGPSTRSSVHIGGAANNEIYKLLFAAGGIYGAFLYYGSLQEDVFRYVAPDGTMFKYAWCLQVFEALSNTIVGYMGRHYNGPTPGLSLSPFFFSGASQVCSKAFTSLSLASGLSFPVATLAKSGKMAPVMAGQLLLGGSTYSLRDYLQVTAIIGGTVLLSLGKKKVGDDHGSTNLGVIFIILSLVMDGITAGIQKRLKVQMIEKFGKSPKPYDFMFYTNLSMMVVAFFISLVYGGDFIDGYSFLYNNAECRIMVIKFCLCSAIGQSFIFYTVAHFDPLVCTTLTTTRKVISVIWSILTKGHALAGQGWIGILVASTGLGSEMQQKISKSKNKSSFKDKDLPQMPMLSSTPTSSIKTSPTSEHRR